jgi:hypothetical protein
VESARPSRAGGKQLPAGAGARKLPTEVSPGNPVSAFRLPPSAFRLPLFPCRSLQRTFFGSVTSRRVTDGMEEIEPTVGRVRIHSANLWAEGLSSRT